MTKTSSMVYRLIIAWTFLTTSLFVTLVSCRKEDKIQNKNSASSYSADVLDKWMTLQQRMMRNATGISNHGLTRHFAYAGVAALEAIKPGINGPAAWSDKYNGLTGLPAAEQAKTYYYPANVNAAMAAINKAMFPAASEADKLAIDSLEAALNQSFLTTEPQARIHTSSTFGKAVAVAVFNWAETDGYKVANNPYTPPTGPGKWVPTPSGFANAATPYWGANRTIITGSMENTQPAAPLPYSTDPSSVFYQMVKQVYDASQNLTDDQKAMSLFWKDVPGATSPGHWLCILQQVVRKTHAPLDKAALAYALTGVAGNDALISCFKTKYQYNLVRPITYIRDVMGHNTWTSFIGTPAHPEYSSSHATLSSTAAAALENVFGNTGSFTDHTYDYLGLAPRTYSSFTAIGEEAAQSRLYAGIHYQPSINAGIAQGRKVVANILGNHIK